MGRRTEYGGAPERLRRQWQIGRNWRGGQVVGLKPLPEVIYLETWGHMSADIAGVVGLQMRISFSHAR
jgi:hypothetical protein